ncbi:MAG TPA: DOMON domain-containing protein [Spirochaetota bacterium]|nr:DOMON domain-containing protein [Spirochaetota bacterium]HOL56052.1 DOMON domain-containing protein [Spirochaetota bacterium]HPP03198.1 DOMON domain-containing protein [Spirochaetota bacterium]
MKKICCFILFFVIVYGIYSQNNFIEIKKEKFIFKYRYTDNTMDVIISANTTGWIAVGFNPTLKMKNANYILGYVKDGVLYIEDHFGDSSISHSSDILLGGTNDIINPKGSEKNGWTEISFSISRKPTDKFDTEIKKGKNKVIMALGLKDDFTSKHVNIIDFEIILK